MDDKSLEVLTDAYNTYDGKMKLFNKIRSYLPYAKLDIEKTTIEDLILLFHPKKTEKLNDTLSSIFKCPKCKGNHISNRQEQLRGADEASTTILNCKTCTHTWIYH